MRIHRQIINQLLSGMEQVSAIIHNKDLSPQEKVMMIKFGRKRLFNQDKKGLCV